MKSKSHIPIVLVALALLASIPGCGTMTDQQKLDAAKQTYTNANTIISIAIAAGYIAHNDQALKDAIFQASATIRDDLAKAQDYINAGNHLTFQFWFDSAMNGLATFMQYQADAERKIKLSNPATRPALPGKVTAAIFYPYAADRPSFRWRPMTSLSPST